MKTKLQEKLSDDAKELWDDLSELAKVEIKEALEDLAELTLLSSLGEEVEREVLHAKARLANWEFVGADIIREKVKLVLRELAELLGGFLKGLAT
jgi:hypothetical protein